MRGAQLGFWSSCGLICIVAWSRRHMLESGDRSQSLAAGAAALVAVLLVVATVRAARLAGCVDPSRTREAIWGVGMIALILASLALRIR
jgi:hypothetical protein